jgi:hypothetical protein
MWNWNWTENSNITGRGVLWSTLGAPLQSTRCPRSYPGSTPRERGEATSCPLFWRFGENSRRINQLPRNQFSAEKRSERWTDWMCRFPDIEQVLAPTEMGSQLIFFTKESWRRNWMATFPLLWRSFILNLWQTSLGDQSFSWIFQGLQMSPSITSVLKV